MPTYAFRLRFNLPESYRIASDVAKLKLFTSTQGECIKLFSGNDAIPIKDCSSPAIIGGQYSIESEAKAAAEKSKYAFLFWAIEQRVGIDFGDGKQRSLVTNEGLAYYQEKYGCLCRNDILGIDIYEHITPIKFISVKADAQVGKYPPNLITTFQQEYTNNRQLTPKQVLASEIYASSFFDVSPRTRFITLVTAVEALLTLEKRGKDVQVLIDKWLSEMEKAKINQADMPSLRGGLKNLHNQSIGQAGRALAQRLLPDELFNGKSSAVFFKDCYNLRSQLVHSGALTDSSIDILQLANEMERFVHKLLLGELNSANIV